MPIAFSEAIPIACLGLAVNVVSAWLLGDGEHHHHGHGHHGHGHHGRGHAEDEDAQDHPHDRGAHGHGGVHALDLGGTRLTLDIQEDGVPPRFRVRETVAAEALWAETVRPDGARQRFVFTQHAGGLASVEDIPEPHAFSVNLHFGNATASTVFTEPVADATDGDRAHGGAEHHYAGDRAARHSHAEHRHAAHQDNNMRAAIVHVMADAAVSVLVIVGLLLARAFGWLWMDPLAGIVGACVIASWAYGLSRDAGRILLDMNPDRQLTDRLRQEIEADGDRLTDLHIWRLGPGHLGAVLSVVTGKNRRPEDYRRRLQQFASLSHITVEVQLR